LQALSKLFVLTQSEAMEMQRADCESSKVVIGNFGLATGVEVNRLRVSGFIDEESMAMASDVRPCLADTWRLETASVAFVDALEG